VFSLIILEAFTGIFIFLFLLMLLLFYASSKIKGIPLKILFIILALLLPSTGTITIIQLYKNYFTAPKTTISCLPTSTANGNPYTHNFTDFPIENGKYTGLTICEPELRKAWNQLSHISYDSLDKRNQVLKFTLIRYLTSKDLSKDSSGLFQLTSRDIKNVENGIANYNYTLRFNPYKRLLEFFWEFDNYRRTGDPSGHSAMQRFEYWKVAKQIFKSNWVIGVGTGDIKHEFDKNYEQTNSPLKTKYRLRAHNQYITMGVAFGILGLLIFLFILFYPGYARKLYSNYFFLTFFFIAIMSMLTEDTLETQAGVSFFAFFFSLFIFGYQKNDDNL
jgi:hypothetical protein